MDPIERDIAVLWQTVTRQGQGLTTLEPLVNRIKGAVNNQAQGLRNLEQRVAQLEALLVNVARTQQTRGAVPPVSVTRFPTRTVNAPPLRALPAVGRPDFVDVDDASADDGEYEDDDEQEAG